MNDADIAAIRERDAEDWRPEHAEPLSLVGGAMLGYGVRAINDRHVLLAALAARETRVGELVEAIEPLRPELERLAAIDPDENYGCVVPTDTRAVRRIMAALAAPPASRPAVDVERLAKALHAAGALHTITAPDGSIEAVQPDGCDLSWERQHAEKVAREYEVLP